MAISRRQQRKLVREGGGAGLCGLCGGPGRPAGAGGRPGGLPGEPGCYSEEAAVGFFGPEVSSRGWPGSPTCSPPWSGEADYAVLPVENSSTGSIRQVYDLLARYNYYVVGSAR